MPADDGRRRLAGLVGRSRRRILHGLAGIGRPRRQQWPRRGFIRLAGWRWRHGRLHVQPQ
jgi:hypothetical protein